MDSTGSEPFILYREDITHSSVNDGMDLMPISLERDGSFGMDDMLNGEDLTLEANDFLPIEVPPPVPARVPGQVLLKQKVTKGAKDKKKRVLYVDAATQVEEDSAVGEIPFACVEAVGFKHPELRHELSILSWLSSQVTNPEFEIGVPILAADEASASFNKRVYSTASDKRARDFLTTTVLIDAGSRQDTPNPGNSMYSLSPPSLEHQSSALAFSIENDWVFNEYAPNGVGGVDGGV